MKKYVLYFLSISTLFFFVNSDAAEQKQWTVLVYMAAANDLSARALADLQDMMKVGSNSSMNIIVYLTIQQEGQPKQTKKLYIEQGGMQQIGPVLKRDSGDIATLAEALQWACLDYPSDHIVVDLWNHGDGPLNRNVSPSKGVCYDYDTGHYLTDRDCLNAFLWIKDNVRGGKNFDIVICDACLLASLEMAYTFSCVADYFIASQEVIPKGGLQYNYLLSFLAKQNNDTLSFVNGVVSAYEKAYSGSSHYTLSATDLNALFPLVDNVNCIAQILSSQLKGKNASAIKNIIKKCVSNNTCLSFDKGIYIDLYQFYKNLLRFSADTKLTRTVSQQFKQLLTVGVGLFPKLVMANVASKNYKQAGGLSIYFSKYKIDPSYYGLYWTEKNPNWLNFLEAFVG